MRLPHFQRFWLRISCILVVAVSVYLYYSFREPTYEGKSISYWFNELPLVVEVQSPSTEKNHPKDLITFNLNGNPFVVSKESDEKAIQAIRVIGQNGLPFIFSKLESDSNPTLVKIFNFSAKHDWVWLMNKLHNRFTEAGWDRTKAVSALIAIQPLPDDAIHRLQRLSSIHESDAAMCAQYVLLTTNQIIRAGFEEYFPREKEPRC